MNIKITAIRKADYRRHPLRHRKRTDRGVCIVGGARGAAEMIH